MLRMLERYHFVRHAMFMNFLHASRTIRCRSRETAMDRLADLGWPCSLLRPRAVRRGSFAMKSLRAGTLPWRRKADDCADRSEVRGRKSTLANLFCTLPFNDEHYSFSPARLALLACSSMPPRTNEETSKSICTNTENAADDHEEELGLHPA
jgi:hypothetical protein